MSCGHTEVKKLDTGYYLIESQAYKIEYCVKKIREKYSLFNIR